jgi:hypothetical protein
MRSMTFVLVLLAAAACGSKEKSAPAQPAPVAKVEAAPEPAPPPEPPPTQPVAVAEGSTGSPECDAYLAYFDRIRVECAKELGPAKDALDQSAQAQREAFAQWNDLDEEGHKAAVEAARPGCLQAKDALTQAATSMGCAID